MFEKIKDYYDQGLWGEPRVRGMVIRRILTPEEYGSIIGEPIGEWEPDDGTMKGATEAADGKKGVVPAPEKGSPKRFLNAGGIWTPADGGDADLVDGFHASVDDTASGIVVRGADKSIKVGAIISDTPNGEDPAVSQVLVTNGMDDRFRRSGIANIKRYMAIPNIISDRLMVNRFGAGSGGFINFMEIRLATHKNYPVMMFFVPRGGNVKTVVFCPHYYSNDAGVDLVCSKGIGNIGGDYSDMVYCALTSTNVWDLYFRNNYNGSAAIIGISETHSITMKNTHVTSLPSGYIQATEKESIL